MLGVTTGFDAVLQTETRLLPAPILMFGVLISLLWWDAKFHIVHALFVVTVQLGCLWCHRLLASSLIRGDV